MECICGAVRNLVKEVLLLGREILAMFLTSFMLFMKKGILRLLGFSHRKDVNSKAHWFKQIIRTQWFLISNSETDCRIMLCLIK